MMNVKVIAVAAALLAVPFGAFAETAVTDSQAVQNGVWTQASPVAATATNNFGADDYQARLDMNGDRMSAHRVAVGSTWADNYLAGRVEAPAGR